MAKKKAKAKVQVKKPQQKIVQLLNQALQSLNQQDYVTAEANCQKVLELDQSNFDALHILGIIASNVGMLDVAIELFNAAIAVNPRVGFVYGSLANVYKALSMFDLAIENYNKALSINPNDADANNNLGGVYVNLGDYRNALHYLHKAEVLSPDIPEVNTNLGGAYLLSHDMDKAATHLEKAMRLNPTDPTNYVTMSRVFQDRLMTDEARHCLEAGIAVNDQYFPLYEALGALLLQVGDKKGAAEQYRKVLEITPESATGLMGLAVSKSEYLTDELIAEFEARLENGDLTQEQQCNYCFALGRVFDAKGDYDKAFSYISRANALKNAHYNRDDMAAFIDGIIEYFDKDFFTTHAGYGNQTDKPIFIVGMPRSGTTLVESILSSHPDVFGAGESNEMNRLALSMPAVLGSGHGYPACLDDLTEEKSRVYASLFLRFLEGFGMPERHIIEKMPTNFIHLGIITLLFPRAHVVYCKRNPINVGVSNYFQDFVGELFWSYNLEDFVHYYKQHERLMQHWREVLPGKMYEVQYEELVAEQERISRELLAHCGLEWTDECLDFHKSKRVVSTASLAQVRQPIYKSSVQRWKKYESHITPLLEGFPEWAQ